MRISDWSSDVCSSDLAVAAHGAGQLQRPLLRRAAAEDALPAGAPARPAWRTAPRRPAVPLAPPLARALGKLPAGDDRPRGAGRGARGRPARLAGPGGVAAVPARRLVVAAHAGGLAPPPGSGAPRRAGGETGRASCWERVCPN